MYRRIRAFTLVELLVVIGIIALLISILLPALGKARQQANLINCSSQLHQMGQAMGIYCVENKGYMPWGDIYPTKISPSNQESYWFWNFTLSEIMNRNLMGTDGLVHNLSPVFRDNDTIVGNDFRWVCHYTCNMSLFYSSNIPDVSGSLRTTPRNIASVKQSSQAFVIWDAPQISDPATQYNAYPLAESIDAWGWANNGLSLDVLSQPHLQVNGAIFPGQKGQSGTGNAAAGLKGLQYTSNYDPPIAFGGSGWTSHLRFRHLKNTTLAALCLDGHIETRKVGTVLRSDIYTNYIQPPASP